MKHTDTTWYSVVVSILMVWFLLIITTWIFQLVLSDLNDGRGREGFLQASAGAEGAMELVLLSIKREGYGFYDTIESWVNARSIMLSDTPLDVSKFRKNDMQISYDMDSKVHSYSGTLRPLWFDIIPLFYINSDLEEEKVEDVTFNILSPTQKISWNIVSSEWGISGEWNFDATMSVNMKWYTSAGFQVSQLQIHEFLGDESRASPYLILFNADRENESTYELYSADKTRFFTKPRAEIVSSARIWKYKQNFRTIVDNTEYLNILKYSVFSN